MAENTHIISNNTPIVVSVERTLIILNLLAENVEGLGTREISHRLGYSAGSVQKILNTLRVQDFIVKRPDTDQYVFGPAAMRLAHFIMAQTNLWAIARPFMDELAEETGETIFLGTRDGSVCNYVDKIVSKHIIRMDAPLGSRPLNCTAMGKVLLAFDTDVTEDTVVHLAQSGAFESPTERSITDPGEFYHELLQVREMGYAFDLREYNPSAACVAAAILDRTGKPVAAISVTGPAERIEQQQAELGSLVQKVGERLSKSLGFSHLP